LQALTKAGVPGMFRVPIDLVIRNGNVEFSRPLLNWNATRVVGNEMASGTIDPDGKIHLTSTWYNGRAGAARGDQSTAAATTSTGRPIAAATISARSIVA
jgi:hypothetical protein